MQTSTPPSHQIEDQDRTNGDHANGAPPHHEEVIPKDLQKISTGKVIVVTVVFLLLLVALFLIGYIPDHRREAELDREAKSSYTDKPIVSVVQVKRQEAGSDLMLPGTAEALQQTSIFPRANGYLKKQYVDIGDKVKAGQLLAEIDTPEVNAQLAQAQASVLQAQANIAKAQNDYSLAKTTYERYVSFGKTGGVTQQDVDTKEADLTQAKAVLDANNASLAAAQADVKRLEATQGFQNLYAPFAGVITARNYDLGALLSSNTNQPMFQLADVDTLRVFVSVPQSYANMIKVGLPAKLSVTNYGGKLFDGKVARTADALDPTTRTLRTEVDFDNKNGELYAGMYGMIRFKVESPTPPILMPTSAIVYDAKGLHVAVVADGKVHFQDITVGRDLGQEIEVASGLKDGQMIVANPGERISEGGEVEYENPKQQKESGTAQGSTKSHTVEAMAK